MSFAFAIAASRSCRCGFAICTMPAKSRDQWTMLINYRAPSLLADGERPYRRTRISAICSCPSSSCSASRNRWSIPRCSRTRSSSSASPRRACGRVQHARSATGQTCPESSSTRAWRTASSRTASSRRRRATSRIATVLIVAIAVGLLSAFLPFAAAAGTTAAILGGWTWFSVSAFKGGVVAEHGPAARRRAPSRSLPAPPTSTSSKAARSGR